MTIGGATDIHGSKFDQPENPIAVNGTLNSSIKPATLTHFVDMLNTTQLARFGLHNGKVFVHRIGRLLNVFRRPRGPNSHRRKMGEHCARACRRPEIPARFLPVHGGKNGCSAASRANLDLPLTLQADNDFISTQGVSIGQPFNAGLDNDNQFLVYRVTLPTAH